MANAPGVNAIHMRRTGKVAAAIAAVLLLAAALAYGRYVGGWLGDDAVPTSASGSEAGKMAVDEAASEAPPVATAALRQGREARLAESEDGIKRTLTDDGLLLEEIQGKDFFQAIFNPKFLSADTANALMGDDDLVIGLSINGDHRAYSVPYLGEHEVVNDFVGGVPVVITW